MIFYIDNFIENKVSKIMKNNFKLRNFLTFFCTDLESFHQIITDFASNLDINLVEEKDFCFLIYFCL